MDEDVNQERLRTCINRTLFEICEVVHFPENSYFGKFYSQSIWEPLHTLAEKYTQPSVEREKSHPIE